MEPTTGSVSVWLDGLRAGDPAAAQPLWEHFFERLVGLARHRLAGLPRRVADEEDIALSAFHSVYRAAGQGRFPRLDDRHDLWQVLVVVAERKATKTALSLRRQKRGGGAVRGDSALGARSGGPGFDRFESPEPTPDFAAQVAEECGRLLELLGDPELRQIAVWKMEGHTVEEIAARLDCVPRTVLRRLEIIRRTWDEQAPA
jgi:DNA-directed RNA polymerase specialized sigma24 family protein